MDELLIEIKKEILNIFPQGIPEHSGRRRINELPIERKKEFLHVFPSGTPEQYPLDILKAYLHNTEAGRWFSNAWGDSDEGYALVREMNNRLDREEEALHQAIKKLEEP